MIISVKTLSAEFAPSIKAESTGRPCRSMVCGTGRLDETGWYGSLLW